MSRIQNDGERQFGAITAEELRQRKLTASNEQDVCDRQLRDLQRDTQQVQSELAAATAEQRGPLERYAVSLRSQKEQLAAREKSLRDRVEWLSQMEAIKDHQAVYTEHGVAQALDGLTLQQLREHLKEATVYGQLDADRLIARLKTPPSLHRDRAGRFDSRNSRTLWIGAALGVAALAVLMAVSAGRKDDSDPDPDPGAASGGRSGARATDSGPGSASTLAGAKPPSIRLLGAPSRETDQASITITAVAHGGNRAIESFTLRRTSPQKAQLGDDAADGRSIEVQGSWTVPLAPGENRLELIATASHLPHTIPLVITYVDPQTRPRLFVLAVGISKYPENPLNFADRDARAVHDELRQRVAVEYGQVIPKLLVDKKATRQGVLGALGDLGDRMNSKDVAVVFFAGHGQRDGEEFYLVAYDTDWNALLATGIAQSQLQEALRRIPGRVVLMLDCCHAGAAAADTLTEWFKLGTVFMGSCAADQAARENAAVQHGYFTQAVLEGLRGGAHSEGVDTKQLGRFVSDRLPELTGGQAPVSTTENNPIKLVRAVEAAPPAALPTGKQP